MTREERDRRLRLGADVLLLGVVLIALALGWAGVC